LKRIRICQEIEFKRRKVMEIDAQLFVFFGIILVGKDSTANGNNGENNCESDEHNENLDKNHN